MKAVVKIRRALRSRFYVMSLPGRADDGSDTAWFLTRSGATEERMWIGDGDVAGDRARAATAELNRARRVKDPGSATPRGRQRPVNAARRVGRYPG